MALDGKKTSLSLTYTQTFQPAWGMFSPGFPLTPTDPQPVRKFDFAVGTNTVISPRPYEPFGFAELRAFSNVEMVRLAIETRKDQLERHDWQIKPKNARKTRKDADERIRKLEKFWAKPDGVTPFATWLRLAVEDLLTLDAPAFEKRRNFGGDLIGVDVIPGDTIKLLVDETGRRPVAPAPAYQQIIKGRVWTDLTTNDLIYAPRNPRTNHLYGFGPVEQVVVTLTTAMRRQSAQLAYFVEGNLPAGMLNAPEGWTAEQLKDFQEWFDARLAGNTAERSKLLWGPFGSKYQAFKESPIKDEFDEWLARIVCFCFSLPPTPFVKQLNRSTAESDGERSLEEGLAPLKLWAKRVIDPIIQVDLGFPDLEFSWNDGKEIEPAVQSEIDDRDLRNGSATLDDVRDRRGLDAYPGGIGKQPMVYTAKGAVPVKFLLEQPDDDGADGDAAGNGPDKPSDTAPPEDE
jgi:hypothetical protein